MPHPTNDLPPGLGAPALRALAGAGLTRLDLVARVAEADLRKLHGVGPKAIRLLRAALEAGGRSFADPAVAADLAPGDGRGAS